MIILFGNDRCIFHTSYFIFTAWWDDIRDSRSGSDASRDYFVALTFEIKNAPIQLNSKSHDITMGRPEMFTVRLFNNIISTYYTITV